MYAPSQQRRKALAIAATAHAIQDGLSAAIYVLLPILAQTFGLSFAQVGLFKGVKNLSQALLEILSGSLAERIGAVPTLVFSLVLAGIGYAFLGGVEQAEYLLLCLLLVGVGSAFQHAPASSLVSEAYATAGRRSALGLYNSAGDVGKLTFSACFSLAIGLGIMWQQIAVAYGFITLLAALTLWMMVPARSQPLARVQSSTALSPLSTKASGWGILNRSAYAKLLLVITLDNMVQAGVLVFAAFAMIEKGLPLYIATLAAVVVLTGGVFGKAGCGYLAQYLGAVKAFVLIQLATVAGLLLLLVSPSWVAFFVLLPLGMVSQGSTSITYGLVPDLIHKDRLARGYALMYSLTSFAAALGPFFFGLIADSYGISGALTAMAVISFIAWIPLFSIPLSE